MIKQYWSQYLYTFLPFRNNTLQSMGAVQTIFHRNWGQISIFFKDILVKNLLFLASKLYNSVSKTLHSMKHNVKNTICRQYKLYDKIKCIEYNAINIILEYIAFILLYNSCNCLYIMNLMTLHKGKRFCLIIPSLNEQLSF
jgi:hypothetical protein